MEIKCSFETKCTVVANEFIDCYMAAASGEYVKIYLYMLRHQQKTPDINQVAEALNYTEADVRRAMAYWQKAGVWEVQEKPGVPVQVPAAKREKERRPIYSQEQVNQLGEDEDFTQLVYIAQKYLSRIFTSRDVEVFAYLYDGLHMNAELLEYLVEHCVQAGHANIRYIEAVAISWHQKGFVTAEEARGYAESFTKNTFSVMKAFGLGDRKPGVKEKEMIERWFGSYGFTKELVLEACNRTMDATHTPSFQYADKILSGWRDAGVRTMQDVVALDERHQAKSRTVARTQKKPVNQFHNFEQRETDYDSMVLEQVKTWIQN